MIQYNYVGDGTSIFESKELDKKLFFVSNKLKNHKILNELDTYRLHIIIYYDNDSNICHETHYISKSFKFPNGMSKEDGFKVLSYILDNIQKDSFEDYLQKINFGVIDLPIKRKDNDVLDLFIVKGKIKRFKLSKYYDKYFNWYIKGISKEEIETIYNKLGLLFNEMKSNIKIKCISKRR